MKPPSLGLTTPQSVVDEAWNSGSQVAAVDTVEDQFLSSLVERNRLAPLAAERLRRVQHETMDRLANVILKLGLLSESDLATEMAAFSGLERVRPEQFREPSLAKAEAMGLRAPFLRVHEIVPLYRLDQFLHIACWDALDSYSPRALAFGSGLLVQRVIATRREILGALDALYPPDEDPLRDSIPERGAFEDEVIDRMKDLANEDPVIRLVQRVIAAAVVVHASDIHFEPSSLALSIRFRLDGLLKEIESHSPDVGAAVVSRIKVMAGLNIAERRLPQDGRIRTTVHGKEIDFRVATSPALHGESVVLRILDRDDVALDFAELGYDEASRQILRSAISRPHGIVLVTGPTGSGKTTTLYAALKEVNTPDRKLLTVEDPVEYVLSGVTQVPVKPQIGLTFATTLRAFLRQDPDVLMVGEIRDQETAEIAIQAALTGHLLFSTLHTNTAAAAVARLLDMGIDDYLLTSTLHLIVGQRLLRKLCELCREPYEPAKDTLERFGLDGTPGSVWYRAKGCSACHGLGYKGRTTIAELLLMTDDLRAKIMERADARALEQLAVSNGMRTLFQHGLDRVQAGTTTLEEVVRLTTIA